MLQEQFLYRLLLIVALGFVYIRTMMKMGLYQPAEEQKKYTIMKVIGYIFLLLALFEGVMGIYLITQVQHPSEMSIPPISPDGIIRMSDPIWGYVTTQQQYVVTFIVNTMISLGLGAYFLFYQKSNSTWWKKILKILFGLLFYGFYLKATDFHYFDIWEFLPLLLFVLMSSYVVMKAKRSDKVISPQEVLCDKPDFKEEMEEEEVSRQEDKTRYMPKNLADNVSEPINTVSHEDTTTLDCQIIQQDEEKPVYMFCRYCGKKIDYEGVKYCKHCGKPLD